MLSASLNIKNILLHPINFWLGVKTGKQALPTLLLASLLGAGFCFIFIMLIINTITAEEWQRFGALEQRSGLPFFVLTLIGLFLGYALFFGIILLESAGLRFFSWVFGAKGTWKTSFRIAAFGATPHLLFGSIALLWSPLISGLLSLGTLFLQIHGVSVLHEVNLMKAALITILAPLIVMVTLLLGAFLFVFTIVMIAAFS